MPEKPPITTTTAIQNRRPVRPRATVVILPGRQSETIE